MARWKSSRPNTRRRSAVSVEPVHITKPTRPGLEGLPLDINGCPVEHTWLAGVETYIHYDDVPEQDLTTHKGLPTTTPLRAVIDLAAAVDPDDLAAMVTECLERGLFTVAEARARVAADDMANRPGAVVLRRYLAELGEGAGERR